MKKFLRLKLVIPVLLVLIFCLGVFLSPFVTVYCLISDGVEGNAADIISFMDKAILKDNIKTQFRESMMKKASAEIRYNPFFSMGVKLGMDMADPMIDEIISASYIKEITNSLRVGNVGWMEKMKIKMGIFARLDCKYKSFSEFAFYPEMIEKFEITLSRNTLITWKITNVILPQKVLFPQ